MEEITKSALINDDPTSDEGGRVTQTHSNNQRVKYGNVHNRILEWNWYYSVSNVGEDQRRILLIAKEVRI